VDAERLGCLGCAGAARRCLWLAASEPRLRACVLAGRLQPFAADALQLAATADDCLPGLLRFGDVTELMGLVAPRALQLLHLPVEAEPDGAAFAASCALLTRLYDTLLRPQGFSAEVLEQGCRHTWESASGFLGRNLGLPRPTDYGVSP